MSVQPRGLDVEGSILRDTAVLSMAGLVTRLLGVLFKPLAVRIIAPFDGQGGNVGMGLFNIPATTLVLCAAFLGTGISVAVSQVMAREGVQQSFQVQYRLRQFELMSVVFGVILFGLVFFLADPLSALRGAPEAATGYRAIAPAAGLMALVSVHRGYCLAVGRAGVNAWSQVIEQVIRVTIGLTLAAHFLPRGLGVGAAALNAGASAGILIAVGFLIWKNAVIRVKSETHDSMPSSLSDLSSLVSQVTILAAPVALSASMLPLFAEVDNLLGLRLFLTSIPRQDALAALGQLANSTLLISLPIVFSYSLTLSIVPKVATATMQGKVNVVRKQLTMTLRFVLFFGVPSTTAIATLAGPMYSLVFGTDQGALVLYALSGAALLVVGQQALGAILQGIGQTRILFMHLLAGLAMKIATVYVLAPFWGGQGAASSTVLALLLVVVLHGYALRDFIAWGQLGVVFMSSLVSAAAMLSLIYGVRLIWPHSGPFWQLSVVLPLALVAYTIATLRSGGITSDELNSVALFRQLTPALRRVKIVP